MPTLSIYIGESQISALLYKSPSDFEFSHFSYVYPQSLIVDGSNKDKFNKQVLALFAKRFGVKISDITVITGDLMGESGVYTSLSSIQDYDWLYADNFTIATPEEFISFFPYGKDSKFSLAELKNYFSNRSLYPQYISSSPKFLNAADMLLREMMQTSKHNYYGEKPVILTGGRFAQLDVNPVMTYVLGLSLLKDPGLYDLRLDSECILPVLSLLNNQAINKEEGSEKESVSALSADMVGVFDKTLFEEKLTTLGTVLKVPGGVECLFEKDVGEPQLISLKENEIFVFPLDKLDLARISVTGKSINKLETSVRGGTLGFVIDTRQSDYNEVKREWLKVIQERISAF
jgi:hypothetical protein